MPAINRQIALLRVFTTLAKDLPVGTDEPYRVEWGEAGTEARFAKMRRCLESFVDLHLKHPPEYRRSIAEWRDDLRWLEREVGAQWLPKPPYPLAVDRLVRPDCRLASSG